MGNQNGGTQGANGHWQLPLAVVHYDYNLKSDSDSDGCSLRATGIMIANSKLVSESRLPLRPLPLAATSGRKNVFGEQGWTNISESSRCQ